MQTAPGKEPLKEKVTSDLVKPVVAKTTELPAAAMEPVVCEPAVEKPVMEPVACEPVKNSEPVVSEPPVEFSVKETSTPSPQ